jgi:16S rRNA (cytosine967-C5)-methyltransferase
MHPTALLDLTSDLLRSVLRFEAPTDAVVSSFFRQHRQLGQRERQTLADTVYTVLRLKLRLEHLAPAGQGTQRWLAILGWQGTETFLQAALTPAERDWLDSAQRVDLSTLPASTRHNLPDWIVQALGAQLDPAAFDALAESLNQPAPLDLRVNPLRIKRDALRSALREQGIESEPTPWSPWGLRVDGKPALHKLPAFERGDFEVQDEGSQLLALLTEARRGEMVVDFCAGAGGKTLALGAMMRNTGRLYAFDVAGHRLEALKPRLVRSGLTNVYPSQIAHERDGRIQRLAGKVDRVLVDAPCSGLGTLRRNPDLKWRQSPKVLAELRDKQLAILTSAARLVKPGGRLVYATCSLLEAENEHIVAAFQTDQPQFLELPVPAVLERQQVADAAALTAGPHMRLWPHRHRTDGFFAACWQRR